MSPIPFDVNILLSIHYNALLVIVILTALWCFEKNALNINILTSNKSQIIGAFFLSLLVIFFWGLRGHRGFGDTGYYVYSYENLYDDYIYPDFNNEWLWNNLTHFLKELNVPTTEYLLIIELLYVGSMFISCLRLTRDNQWIGMLFFLCSLSFLGYGINGIRNGLACSILLVGITFANDKSILIKILSVLLMIFAIGIHAATIIPVVCCFLAILIVKKVNIAIIIWMLSILVSLIGGNYFSDLFANLGFDDRAARYLIDAEQSGVSEIFSNTGFRWDFLLYGMVPIVFTYYLRIYRGFEDRTFDIIAITYILANAFWIIVIRATYSNRFAYLSWFLYPIVMSYPLLRFKIWNSQWAITAIILILYYGFTYIMYLIGH